MIQQINLQYYTSSLFISHATVTISYPYSIYLVSNKSVGPGLRLEVPDHEAGVHGAGGELLHVRVEGDAGHSVSMTLEVSLQRRVFLQDRYFQIMLTINI